jgi:hypothetical protein
MTGWKPEAVALVKDWQITSQGLVPDGSEEIKIRIT